MSNKNEKYTGKTVKVVCEAYPENWLEFRADITQRQYNRYTVFPSPEEVYVACAKELKKNPDDLTAEEKASAESEETIRHTETVTGILREVVVDGVLIVDGQEVRGIDAILDADFEGVTMPVVSFWGAAFFQAVNEAMRLGKPIRAS